MSPRTDSLASTPLPKKSLARQLNRRIMMLSAVGVVGLVSAIGFSFNAQWNRINLKLAENSTRVVNQLDGLLNTLKIQILSASELITLSEDTPQTLQLILLRHPEFTNAQLWDLRQTKQIHASNLTGGHSSVSIQDWLKEPPKVGEVSVGKVNFNNALPRVMFAVTVSDDIGLPQSLLVVEVELSDLWRTNLQQQVSDNSVIVLTDTTGSIITARQPQWISKAIQPSPKSRLSKSEDTLFLADGWSNNWIISHTSPLKDAPWFAIIEQPVEEAFALFIGTSVVYILILILTTGLLASTFFFIRRRIIKPLLLLGDHIGHSTLNTVWPAIQLEHNDELAWLGHQLNTISQENQNLYATLEEKIKLRTKELAQSEENYRKLFYSSSEPMAIGSFPEGKYIEVNDALVNLSGYSKDELIGRDSLEINALANPEERVSIFQTLQEKGYVHNLEINLRNKSDEIRTFLISLDLIALNNQSCYLLTGRDISRRKSFEKTLQLLVSSTSAIIGTEYFQSCVEALSIFFDASYSFISNYPRNAPGTLKTIAFWELNQTVKKPNFSIEPLHQAELNTQHNINWINQDLQTQFPNDLTLKELDVESYISIPILAADGYCWGYIGILRKEKLPSEYTAEQASFLRILATRTAVELERQQASEIISAQLRRSQVLNSITQQIRQCLHLTDILQTTAISLAELFNVCCSQVFKYKESTLIPVAHFVQPGLTSPPYLKFVPSDDNPFLQLVTHREEAYHSENIGLDSNISPQLLENHFKPRQIKSILVVRTAYQEQLNGLILIEQSSHYRKWTSSEIKLIEDVAAQVGIAIAQANLLEQEQGQRQQLNERNQELKAEIKEREQVEKSLQESRKTAEAANKAKSLFLANMSHELRTPLNAILGFSQLLSKDASIPTIQRQTLDIINRSGTHLLDLINDILTMSQIEAGKISLRESDLDLIDLLETLELLLKIQAKEKGLSLTFQYDKAKMSRYIYSDGGKIRQILINLIGNAIKFTKRGDVTVTVFLNPASDKIYFDVADTGVGISDKELSQIFEPFFQNEELCAQSVGTGLGLTISRQFVELLGGEIQVNSEYGQGSQFSFYIPYQPGQKQINLQGHLPSPTQYQWRSYSRKPRILIAEDDVSNQLLLLKILNAIDIEIKTVSNGIEAVAISKEWKPDLIWMDVRMPELGGLEATRLIKKENASPVIIAITANAFDSDKSKALEMGCDDFISKPFHENIVWQKLSKHLNLMFEAPRKRETLAAEPEILSLEEYERYILSNIHRMPLKWRSQLFDASQRLCLSDIDRLILEIPPPLQELRNAISTLSKQFRFDKLISILKEAISHK